MIATARVAVPGDRSSASRRRPIRDDFDAGDAQLLRVQPFGVELDPADAHRLQLHLGLPLVDLGQRLRRQRREEAFRAQLDKLCLRLAEFRRTEPFRTREAMISVPPGSKMSIGVTMPLTVW